MSLQALSNAENFASKELVNKIREILNKAFDEMGLKEGHRRDTLLVEFTKETCLAFM